MFNVFINIYQCILVLTYQYILLYKPGYENTLF